MEVFIREMDQILNKKLGDVKMGRQITNWPGDYGRIKSGSSKKIGKNYIVMLSRPPGIWNKLKITVKNNKTGVMKSTKFIPKKRAISHYKEINSVKIIKEKFKI